MRRWVCGAVVAALAAGCSDGGAAEQADSGVVVTPGDVCYASIGGAPVAECEIEFCPPESLSVTKQSGQWACDGFDAAATCDGNSEYQAFQYLDDVIWVWLRFDPAIAHNYSDATFKALFQDGFVQLQSIREAPTDHSTFMHYTGHFEGFTAPDGLSFQDGRLRLVMHLDAGTAYQDVRSNDPGCCIGDMCWRCTCEYAGFSFPVVIDLDLTVQE